MIYVTINEKGYETYNSDVVTVPKEALPLDRKPLKDYEDVVVVDGKAQIVTKPNKDAELQEALDEISSEERAVKTQRQLEKTMEYSLKAFEIIMQEIDYLRPTTKPESSQWSAMKTKLTELKSIVEG